MAGNSEGGDSSNILVDTYDNVTPFPRTITSIYRCNSCSGLYKQIRNQFVMGLAILLTESGQRELERKVRQQNRKLDSQYARSNKCLCEHPIIEDDIF
jgi:hypothetical protein